MKRKSKRPVAQMRAKASTRKTKPKASPGRQARARQVLARKGSRLSRAHAREGLRLVQMWLPDTGAGIRRRGRTVSLCAAVAVRRRYDKAWADAIASLTDKRSRNEPSMHDSATASVKRTKSGPPTERSEYSEKTCEPVVMAANVIVDAGFLTSAATTIRQRDPSSRAIATKPHLACRPPWKTCRGSISRKLLSPRNARRWQLAASSRAVAARFCGLAGKTPIAAAGQ